MIDKETIEIAARAMFRVLHPGLEWIEFPEPDGVRVKSFWDPVKECRAAATAALEAVAEHSTEMLE